MAAVGSNESGNLMDEFEEAFQSCLLSLTKQEPPCINKEDIELEVQKTTNRFIDVARQMEAFFLRKRFLVSSLKPDMLIKDENQDLRVEIQRKEALLNKHYNRLEEWKACLSDIQKGPLVCEASGVGGNMSNVLGVGGVGRPGGPCMLPSSSQMTPGQQHLQSQLQRQKLQAQQMQQLQMQRMMGKITK